MKILQGLLLALVLLFTTNTFAEHQAVNVRYDAQSQSILLSRTEVGKEDQRFQIVLTSDLNVKQVILNDKKMTLEEVGFKIVEEGESRILVIDEEGHAIRLK